jgi:hypothetical protein
LIANPAFSDPARQSIASQVKLLTFDPSRQALLNEVNQRVVESK